MNIQDAIYEFARQEIIPMIAGESELTAGLLNGVLRASRKKIAINLTENSMLKAVGFVNENGDIDNEVVKDFFDGVFENRDCIPVSLADMVQTITGIKSDNELLKDRIKITRADADRLLDMISK